MEKVISWLGDSDFAKQNPVFGKIEAITTGKNKWGKDEYVLNLEIDGNKRQISLFGDNRNGLIDKFGADENLWIGKSVQIATLEDPISKKKIKQIKGM